MVRSAAMAAFGMSLATLSQFPAQTQTFETSTIRPSPASAKGFSFKYLNTRQFTANNHTLRECIGFAYDINPGLVRADPLGSTPNATTSPAWCPVILALPLASSCSSYRRF
jgi:hypothetical protein